MKILAILNPISGGKNKNDFMDYFKDTTRFFGIESAIFETTGQDDLKKLLEYLSNNSYDLLIAVGGDGTFSLTASAAALHKIAVGVIPLGSANGMAKELGVNQEPKLALNDLLKSRMVKPMDMISINEKIKFLHLADVGINARIVKGFQEDDNRGMFTYGKYLAQEMQDVKPIEYVIHTNGETHRGECVMIVIANGRKFGAGVSITESGNPFDGVFELVIVEEINLGTILKAGLSVVDQIYTPQNVSKVISTNHAEIHFKKLQLLQADGEIIGEFSDLEVKMLAQKFLFQTHLGNPYLSSQQLDA